ncbi:hypothetical protein QQ045_005171 [Rhodiola kirilowii]
MAYSVASLRRLKLPRCLFSRILIWKNVDLAAGVDGLVLRAVASAAKASQASSIAVALASSDELTAASKLTTVYAIASAEFVYVSET